MLDFHLVLGFAIGAILLWILCLGIHKKHIQAIEATAKNALADLGDHAKAKMEEMRRVLASFLEKK